MIGILLAFGRAAPAQETEAQQPPTPKPVQISQNLLRVEGVDAESNIHYVQLLLMLPASPGQSGTEGSHDPPPRFTVECREHNGKRSLRWLLSFGGIAPHDFDPPFRPSPGNPFPPVYPAVNLKMRFEGYIQFESFTESWTELPWGELLYRNPGSTSPNLEDPQFFMQYLQSLPGLRIGYAKAAAGHSSQQLFFATQSMLQQMAKTPACAP